MTIWRYQLCADCCNRCTAADLVISQGLFAFAVELQEALELGLLVTAESAEPLEME